MENAADALIMAGQILVFIVALTVCITSFNSVKDGLDNIIGSTETVALAKDSSSGQYVNYIASNSSNATRIVGVETVVTSMYRALKEDYTLYIKLNDYSFVNTTSIDESVFTTVTANYTIYDDDRNPIITKDVDTLIMVGRNETNALFTRNINTILSNGLYNEIKDKNFKEYLGEYQADTDANSANKSTYRIITYVEY